MHHKHTRMNSTLAYRALIQNTRFTTFEVCVETTSLFICAHNNLGDRTLQLVHQLRNDIKGYIAKHDNFLHALSPLEFDPSAPEVVRRMYHASAKASVGPMAAVAGTIAQMIGEELTAYSPEIIIENGGDIWAKVQEPAVIKVFAGRKAFLGDCGIVIQPHDTPAGICSSSGRFGHSFSFGKADCVTILASSASLADAVATATCNRVQKEEDCVHALEYACTISGVTGAMVIYWDTMAIKGCIELTQTS